MNWSKYIEKRKHQFKLRSGRYDVSPPYLDTITCVKYLDITPVEEVALKITKMS